MENALRANPQDVREQYGKRLKDMQPQLIVTTLSGNHERDVHS
jgi:hypothetical protein